MTNYTINEYTNVDTQCCICLNTSSQDNIVNTKCNQCNSAFLCNKCIINILKSTYKYCPICRNRGIWFEFINHDINQHNFINHIEKCKYQILNPTLTRSSKIYNYHSMSLCNGFFFAFLLIAIGVTCLMIYFIIMLIIAVSNFIHI